MDGIPAEVAAVLRPVLPDLSAEIISAIAVEVPDYSRPLGGEFGLNMRIGVERALRRFVDSIEGPEVIDRRDRRMYVELGRGEMRQGRTLNALLAAYRVGAQLAWRRFVQAGVQAELDPAIMYRVGEAIFAYIDVLSGESIEGYAAEQSAAAGELQRRRAHLVRVLAGPVPPDPEALRAAAERAEWTPPPLLAALLVEGVDSGRLVSRLSAGAVARTLDPSDGLGTAGGEEPGREREVLVFVADPDAPGVRAQVVHAVGNHHAALGPTVPVGASHLSAERARRALELVRSGALPNGRGLVIAGEHTGALLLHADPVLGAELAAQALAPLEALRPAARERLRETLREWLDRQGRIDETAQALQIHPQTVRYRIGQLRDAFGTALDDADVRFELALALRLEGQPGGL